jgi:hypothetical protein
MNQGVAGKLTVALLDYNRPRESERCLRSIHQHFTLPRDQWQLLYLSNGGDQGSAKWWYEQGLIDTLLLNQRNWGCGIAMKQMAQAALTEWVMMVQTDQYAVREWCAEEMDHAIDCLERAPEMLYLDLAGNQGRGNASERAHLINRRRYLDIPGMDEVIGGPGPFAQSKWTERHVQDHCGASFLTGQPLFADNGAWSERDYGPAYGNAKTRHRTDTKCLYILSPFSRRADGFPNLNLTDEEWRTVLAGEWPVEGKIPERDKPHSFVAWPEENP